MTDWSYEAAGLAAVHRQMDRLRRLQAQDPRPVPLALIVAADAEQLTVTCPHGETQASPGNGAIGVRLACAEHWTEYGCGCTGLVCDGETAPTPPQGGAS